MANFLPAPRKRPRWSVFLALPLWPTLVQGLAAQSRPLVTDRPDFTESPVPVPQGSVQLETGLTLAHADGLRTSSGPEALLRWGPSAGFEIRIQSPDYVDAGPEDGFTDLGLGVKVQLGRFASWDVGSIASVTLPTGHEALSTGKPEPQLTVAAARDVAEEWSLGMQVSATKPGDVGGVHLLSTLVVGRALGESVGVFAELAADRDPGGSGAALFHGGFTFGLAPAVQLDLHGAVGLSGNAPDSVVGIGFSTRLDYR